MYVLMGETTYLSSTTYSTSHPDVECSCTQGFFQTVPVARFFAAGHGEFAATVPGGHADIL